MKNFGRALPLPEYNKRRRPIIIHYSLNKLRRRPLTRRKAYITFGSVENITLQSNISHGIAVYHSNRVWATPTLNYSLFTELFIKLLFNLLVCCKHLFCCSGSCCGELCCKLVIRNGKNLYRQQSGIGCTVNRNCSHGNSCGHLNS